MFLAGPDSDLPVASPHQKPRVSIQVSSSLSNHLPTHPSATTANKITFTGPRGLYQAARRHKAGPYRARLKPVPYQLSQSFQKTKIRGNGQQSSPIQSHEHGIRVVSINSRKENLAYPAWPALESKQAAPLVDRAPWPNERRHIRCSMLHSCGPVLRSPLKSELPKGLAWLGCLWFTRYLASEPCPVPWAGPHRRIQGGMRKSKSVSLLDDDKEVLTYIHKKENEKLGSLSERDFLMIDLQYGTCMAR